LLALVPKPRDKIQWADTTSLPLKHLIVEIHDDNDRPVPTGESGEIVIRPAKPGTIFKGYWNQPEATLKAFRNLWFHTGDGGAQTEAGELIFVDRLKDTIQRRGENISSFEVERAVLEIPGILECAAYPTPAEIGEDEVMVAIVLTKDATHDTTVFFSECDQLLPKFAVPRFVRVMDELPNTQTSRILKAELREQRRSRSPQSLGRQPQGWAMSTSSMSDTATYPLAELLLRGAAKHPDRDCIVLIDERATYGGV
jgi:crotonobetaine/carnitine-CoA ligase